MVGPPVHPGAIIQFVGGALDGEIRSQDTTEKRPPDLLQVAGDKYVLATFVHALEVYVYVEEGAMPRKEPSPSGVRRIVCDDCDVVWYDVDPESLCFVCGESPVVRGRARKGKPGGTPGSSLF